ncbi:MAG: MoxR family ATPase [Saprospiraceae bacterium]|nr:MoxR family ATPase [Saprospiraceae bacterium]
MENNSNDNPRNENIISSEKNEIQPTTPDYITSRYQVTAEMQAFRDKIQLVRSECSKMVVGQEETIDLMITCILAGGHVLLEGVPGIAKTLTAKVLSKAIRANFARIQFTPDLLPSDIIGTSVYKMNKSKFKFEKGPIFSNVVLIDEINRAPAKTQAALFEVMEEKQISYDSIQYEMSFPFVVIATMNPVEQEGTYKLPEAQLDRFLMKLKLGYPDLKEEIEILRKFKNDVHKPDLSVVNAIISPDELIQMQKIVSNVHVEDQMYQYICQLVQETRNHGKVYLGASPRSSLAILKTAKVTAAMMGRSFVIPDDIQFVAPHIINHRLILTPDAEMESITPESIIQEIISELEVPR